MRFFVDANVISYFSSESFSAACNIGYNGGIQMRYIFFEKSNMSPSVQARHIVFLFFFWFTIVDCLCVRLFVRHKSCRLYNRDKIVLRNLKQI